MGKIPDRSFLGDRKEPVIERISELVRQYASRSAAARAWGLNVNTLNSYFKNGESHPTPRENVLQRIADSEGTTLEWLKYGIGKSPISPKKTQAGSFSDGLTEMLSYLTNEERSRLASILARKGADTIINLLFEFADLTPSELHRLIRLAQQIREGASKGDQEDDLNDPTHKRTG